jgi:hypothetical protein
MVMHSKTIIYNLLCEHNLAIQITQTIMHFFTGNEWERDCLRWDNKCSAPTLSEGCRFSGYTILQKSTCMIQMHSL